MFMFSHHIKKLTLGRQAFMQEFIWSKAFNQINYRKFKPIWHCCMCYNAAHGKVGFENNWLIPIIVITKNHIKAFQLTRAKD